MDTNLIYLLIGILLAVPIGIVVNLATPRIQEWLTNRPKVSAAKRMSSLQSELAEVSRLHDNTEEFLLTTISTAFLALLFLSIGNAAWALPASIINAPWGLPAVESVLGFVNFVSSIIAFLFFLFTILVCLNFIQLISKIRNFEKYKEDIEARIEQIKSRGISAGLAADLVIESAAYGAQGQCYDVADVLRASIAGGKLEIVADNQLKGDPIPRVPKELTVTYSYNGKQLTRTIKEGQTLSLP